jgi:cholesterol transport system auxiliary component
MRRRGVLAAPALLLLEGCANPLSRPYPEKRLYVLAARRATALPAPAQGRVLVVRSVTPAPGMEGRGLVTRRPGHVQESDFWNEFFAPPAAMVQDALRQWLSDAGLHAAVLDQGSRARADLALESVLVAAIGDGSDPSAPAARLHLQTLLLGLDRTPPRILARGDYDRRVPVAALAPDAVVEGLSRALALVLADLEADLRRVAGA